MILCGKTIKENLSCDKKFLTQEPLNGVSVLVTVEGLTGWPNVPEMFKVNLVLSFFGAKLLRSRSKAKNLGCFITVACIYLPCVRTSTETLTIILVFTFLSQLSVTLRASLLD